MLEPENENIEHSFDTRLNAREKNRRDVSIENTTIIFTNTTGQHEGSVARHSTIPGPAVSLLPLLSHVHELVAL